MCDPIAGLFGNTIEQLCVSSAAGAMELLGLLLVSTSGGKRFVELLGAPPHERFDVVWEVIQLESARRV